jgi:DMSO reductase family type II enzyme molybdopterin subunit
VADPDGPILRPSRREVLAVGAAATLGTQLTGCSIRRRRGLDPAPPDPSFRARYRDRWDWDDSVRSTHNVNCWYQQNCCFHVYTRDGRVVREEQVGDYPQTNRDVPDFNPRGCQKGCSYSAMMYGPARITTPMKRAGPRGSGAFVPISWDQACTEIADQLIDILMNDGSETLLVDPGGNVVSQLAWMSIARLFDLLDGLYLDINCELGDDQQGAAVTYGEPAADRSADDYFHSDLVFIWGGNPAYTQIPNFHFLTEARYNGTKIVAISPDMNASAIHADRWIPVKPGTDAALALGMCSVLIEEGLYDADLVREQTDLPFLVVEETGRLLRESTIDGGSDKVLYRWDEQRDRLVEADRMTLRLGRQVPALEGSFQVKTDDHGTLTVKPAFQLLKERLATWTPERASEACGVPPETIRELARMIAGAKAATNTCTSGLSKYFHGDLLMRAQILVFVLAGHLGRKGAGYVTSHFLLPDGVDDALKKFEQYREQMWRLGFTYGWEYQWNLLRGMSPREAAYSYLQKIYVPSRTMVNSTLFWNYHGGLLDLTRRTGEWGVDLPRDIEEYLDEALEARWQVLEPPPDKEPKGLFVWMGNPLRRVRAAHKLIEELWPKLKLVVVADIRMSSTAAQADYVLPVSGAYEKTTTMAMNTGPLAPFLHTTVQAVDAVGDSRDEWEVACLLAKKLQERARAQGIVNFVGRRGQKRSLDDIYDDLTEGGRLGDKDGEKLSSRMVGRSTNLGGTSWQGLKKKGYTRFTGVGNYAANFGNATDIKPHETISPHTWHTERKTPWATLSGRIQFYIDHPWYLEFGEELPVHKDPPRSGGDFPITMTGGHTRWSIHSTWRTDVTMLRLQRGEPSLWMSVEDARARGVADGDRIEVSNVLGSFVTRARPAPGVMPGQAVMYHGWENFQFEGGMGYRNVQATPLKPLELVGDYPWIKPMVGVRQPGQSDRDTRIEIRKLEEPTLQPEEPTLQPEEPIREPEEPT